MSVKEEHWDFILSIIEKRVAEYRARINEYRLENKDYTLETLVQRTENPVRSMSVGSYLDQFISQLKDENRLGYAESFKGLKSSLLLYCKSLDIKFSAIDNQWLKGYEIHLKKGRCHLHCHHRIATTFISSQHH